jgi:beta-1,4-mannosyl-glycoprotein beta-1,4-N-acetylglucosaminyltransferase
MKIIDCFIFFNELDLLEFRLKLLDQHVDIFVVAESNLTHSGKPKPFYFEENRARFRPWLHKIVYLPVKQTSAGLVFNNNEIAYDPQGPSWKLENEHRNALSAARNHINDEDLVLLSDLDEMPDRFLLKKIKPGDSPVSLAMLFHYYFFNCQNDGSERWWIGTIASSGKQFKEHDPQQLRDNRNNYPCIKKGGWHFSYLGGVEKIKYKLHSFAHTEYNKDEFLQDSHILKSMENGTDILKRPGVSFRFVSLYYYPGYLRKLMQQYPAFVHLKSEETLARKIYYTIKRNLS